MKITDKQKLYVLNSNFYVEVRVFTNRSELKRYASSYWPDEVWGWDFKGLYLHIPNKHFHKGTICVLQDTTYPIFVHELYHAVNNVAKRVHKRFEFVSREGMKTSKKTKKYYEKDNRLEEFCAATMESFYEQVSHT